MCSDPLCLYCSVLLVDQTLTEKFKADDLRMLYKLCFEVTGKVSGVCACVYVLTEDIIRT